MSSQFSNGSRYYKVGTYRKLYLQCQLRACINKSVTCSSIICISIILFLLISVYSIFCATVADSTLILNLSSLFSSQDSDGEDLETEQEVCDVVPVGLLSSYLHMLKRKKEKKLLHVTSKIYLYILKHVMKCLPPSDRQSTVWWNISDDSEKEYTKVQCGSMFFLSEKFEF